MPADLPSVEEPLKDLVKVKASIDVIAGKLSRKPDAVIIKCKRLGFLVVVVQKKKNTCSTTTTTAQLVLPEELPSVEEELKVLVATLKVLVQFPLLGLFPLHPQLLVCI